MTRLSASTENGRSCDNNNCVGDKCWKDCCHRVSMTNIELARAADSSFALHRRDLNVKPTSNPLDKNPTTTGKTVRINLRKRAVSDDREGAVMASCNSAFLSGIFADIANASEPEESDTRLNEGVSIKKSRASMTHSISRCTRSYHKLADIVSPVKSSNPIQFFDDPVLTVHANGSIATEQPGDHAISRENSLLDQLHCVSSSSSNESDSKIQTTDFCKLAFPHLPATVSDQDLTQMLPCRSSSDTPKESYGWFVEMDDDEENVPAYTDAYKTAKADLAFSAPTAPKRTDDDAQVEWAQAADTIDDVLGDFF